MMCALAFQAVAEHGAEAEGIASRFGVDWPHLLAQTVSFGIVCAVLYLLAYKPILKMLEARRQQIASGLANAKKIEAELARIEIERRDVLTKADAYGKQLIEEARAAAARVRTEETRKASAAAEQILVRAQETSERDRAADARRPEARGRTAGAPHDRERHRQGPDHRRSAAPLRGNRPAAGMTR